MDTRFKIFIKASAFGILQLSQPISGQVVKTLEMTTGSVEPIQSRLGTASLIQVPVEPIATQVGDPVNWMVEKNDRFVSVKPTSTAARDTNLAIITRLGTLNFSLHQVMDAEAFSQMVRVTSIIDDSKSLPLTQNSSNECLSDIVVKEIRISQNYYALKFSSSPFLREVDQVTQLSQSESETYNCKLLQTFRFRDTGHIVLHFILDNKSSDSLSFDPRKTVVTVNETIFIPISVSFGRNNLPPNGSMENFLILDGANGLSPKNPFKIHLIP